MVLCADLHLRNGHRRHLAKSSADVATGSIIMACMAITNLTAILLLSPVVHTIASDYLRQRKLGVRPVFDPLRYPDIGRQLSPDAWDDVSQE